MPVRVLYFCLILCSEREGFLSATEGGEGSGGLFCSSVRRPGGRSLSCLAQRGLALPLRRNRFSKDRFERRRPFFSPRLGPRSRRERERYGGRRDMGSSFTSLSLFLSPFLSQQNTRERRPSGLGLCSEEEEEEEVKRSSWLGRVVRPGFGMISLASRGRRKARSGPARE